MEEHFKKKLINLGLSACINKLEEEEIYNLETLQTLDYHNLEEIIPSNFLPTLSFLLKTIKTSYTISQINNIDSTEITNIDSETSHDMRDCYIKLIEDVNLSPVYRQGYIYEYFIKPYIDNTTTNGTISVNYEGKKYNFNKNFISIGRGCPQYPVDIQIKERSQADLSVSRVNCVLIKIKCGDNYKYNLFDAWSIYGTKITKYNPLTTIKTSRDKFNIIKWDSSESVYIHCGSEMSNNKIQVLADDENIHSDNNNSDGSCEDNPECVICCEPASIRLGCGHAVYCGSNCMNSHIAHQINNKQRPTCPYCKKDNLENNVSLCVNQYKI